MRVEPGRAGSARPLVLELDDSDLQRAILRLSGRGKVRVLGGTMSRNIHLLATDQVLRVHAPFVSAARVRAERRLRLTLLGAGLQAARPHAIDGNDVFAVAGRVAEVEQYVAHQVPPPVGGNYRAMFRTLSHLHAALDDETAPRPAVSTYGAPGTLRRHLALLAGRELSARSRLQLRQVASVLGRVHRSWVPARDLPLTVVHGDPRLENLPRDLGGRPVVLDLGFAAPRPRIHDLAHAAAWILLGPDDQGGPLELRADDVRSCVGAYENQARMPLTHLERTAFDSYLAGVCLYQNTVAAYLADPDAHLARPGPRHMLQLATQVMESPRTFT